MSDRRLRVGARSGAGPRDPLALLGNCASDRYSMFRSPSAYAALLALVLFGVCTVRDPYLHRARLRGQGATLAPGDFAPLQPGRLRAVPTAAAASRALVVAGPRAAAPGRGRQIRLQTDARAVVREEPGQRSRPAVDGNRTQAAPRAQCRPACPAPTVGVGAAALQESVYRWLAWRNAERFRFGSARGRPGTVFLLDPKNAAPLTVRDFCLDGPPSEAPTPSAAFALLCGPRPLPGTPPPSAGGALWYDEQSLDRLVGDGWLVAEDTRGYHHPSRSPGKRAYRAPTQQLEAFVAARPALAIELHELALLRRRSAFHAWMGDWMTRGLSPDLLDAHEARLVAHETVAYLWGASILLCARLGLALATRCRLVPIAAASLALA